MVPLVDLTGVEPVSDVSPQDFLHVYPIFMSSRCLDRQTYRHRTSEYLKPGFLSDFYQVASAILSHTRYSGDTDAT